MRTAPTPEEQRLIKEYEDAHESEIFVDMLLKLKKDRLDLYNMVKRVTAARYNKLIFNN